MILCELMRYASLSDTITSLQSTISTSDGMLLLDSLRDHLLPLSTMRILDTLTELGACMHTNGE